MSQANNSNNGKGEYKEFKGFSSSSSSSSEEKDTPSPPSSQDNYEPPKPGSLPDNSATLPTGNAPEETDPEATQSPEDGEEEDEKKSESDSCKEANAPFSKFPQNPTAKMRSASKALVRKYWGGGEPSRKVLQDWAEKKIAEKNDIHCKKELTENMDYWLQHVFTSEERQKFLDQNETLIGKFRKKFNVSVCADGSHWFHRKLSQPRLKPILALMAKVGVDAASAPSPGDTSVSNKRKRAVDEPVVVAVVVDPASSTASNPKPASSTASNPKPASPTASNPRPTKTVKVVDDATASSQDKKATTTDAAEAEARAQDVAKIYTFVVREIMERGPNPNGSETWPKEDICMNEEMHVDAFDTSKTIPVKTPAFSMFGELVKRELTAMKNKKESRDVRDNWDALMKLLDLNSDKSRVNEKEWLEAAVSKIAQNAQTAAKAQPSGGHGGGNGRDSPEAHTGTMAHACSLVVDAMFGKDLLSDEAAAAEPRTMETSGDGTQDTQAHTAPVSDQQQPVAKTIVEWLDILWGGAWRLCQTSFSIIAWLISKSPDMFKSLSKGVEMFAENCVLPLMREIYNAMMRKCDRVQERGEREDAKRRRRDDDQPGDDHKRRRI